jgi:phosphoglycerate dehydrogenase-like enzyme
MPVIVVDDDKVLRFVHVLLDPQVPPARAAALSDFLSFDIPDVEAWIERVRASCGTLYPASVRMAADQDAMREALADADALVVEGLTVGQADLACAPRLRVVHKFGVDTRNIDLDACARAGVEVGTTRRNVNAAVAEHAIALMMAVGRKICETDGALDFESLRALGYRPALYDPDHISGANWARVSGLKGLQGATLGALGLGEVGREVATRARAMEMEVLYHQRTRLSAEIEAESGARYVSFEELLERADFLSVHLPYTQETKGIVDSKAFARLKRGAILVNISRAPVVDRAALIEALDSGHLGGAGLDVHYQEPAAPDEPLKSYANVVLTPHIAVASRVHAVADMEAVVGHLAGFFRGS